MWMFLIYKSNFILFIYLLFLFLVKLDEKIHKVAQKCLMKTTSDININ